MGTIPIGYRTPILSNRGDDTELRELIDWVVRKAATTRPPDAPPPPKDPWWRRWLPSPEDIVKQGIIALVLFLVGLLFLFLVDSGGLRDYLSESDTMPCVDTQQGCDGVGDSPEIPPPPAGTLPAGSGSS